MSSLDLKLPAGFRYSGTACGIKRSGHPDISLIVADRPAVAAGVYTQNQIVAPPVVLCRGRTPGNTIRAVVTNSGNANACTGEAGLRNAVEMCRLIAEQVGCDEADVLVMSTGVIGQPLPMEKVARGIRHAHQTLSAEASGFEAAAEAICTTDQSRKIAGCELESGAANYRVAAMAKGAGMIAPNMATMLAVILTDAPLQAESAQALLSHVCDATFNRISVDGHTSTNDTVLLLSSGEREPLAGAPLQALTEQIESVCLDLAKQIVADGEGAQHFFAIHVEGATDDAAANRIARTIAASPLVKTAITGSDPNWGRIVSAAGNSDAKLDLSRLRLRICGVTVYDDGCPQPFDAAELSKRMQQAAEVPLELRVGDGSGQATEWASDLTTDYVTFNSAYTT